MGIFNKISNWDKKADEKLQDLIQLVHETPPDLNHLYELEHKFHSALNEIPGYRQFREHKDNDQDANLVLIYQKHQKGEPEGPLFNVLKLIRIVVCLLVITLGFAMIILPSAQSFEIYTLFFFNEQDGFTLMDLISLIIIFVGVYALVSTFTKRSAS